METVGVTRSPVEKQIKPRTVRVDERLFQIALSRVTETGADDFSDYVRGLIVADALASPMKITGIDIPGWIVGKRVNFTTIDPNPPAKPVGEVKRGKVGT